MYTIRSINISFKRVANARRGRCANPRRKLFSTNAFRIPPKEQKEKFQKQIAGYSAGKLIEELRRVISSSSKKKAAYNPFKRFSTPELSVKSIDKVLMLLNELEKKGTPQDLKSFIETPIEKKYLLEWAICQLEESGVQVQLVKKLLELGAQETKSAHATFCLTTLAVFNKAPRVLVQLILNGHDLFLESNCSERPFMFLQQEEYAGVREGVFCEIRRLVNEDSGNIDKFMKIWVKIKRSSDNYFRRIALIPYLSLDGKSLAEQFLEGLFQVLVNEILIQLGIGQSDRDLKSADVSDRLKEMVEQINVGLGCVGSDEKFGLNSPYCSIMLVCLNPTGEDVFVVSNETDGSCVHLLSKDAYDAIEERTLHPISRKPCKIETFDAWLMNMWSSRSERTPVIRISRSIGSGIGYRASSWVKGHIPGVSQCSDVLDEINRLSEDEQGEIVSKTFEGIRGDKISLLEWAVCQEGESDKQVELVKKLLELGAKQRCREGLFRYPLSYHAVMNEQSRVLVLLISHGHLLDNGINGTCSARKMLLDPKRGEFVEEVIGVVKNGGVLNIPEDQSNRILEELLGIKHDSGAGQTNKGPERSPGS